MPDRTIVTEYLARVEGEGGMRVEIEDGRVSDVKLNIYEPPRFFEAFLRGRAFTEAPDITARICGICPVAYQMSSVQAMERICGVTIDGQLRALRRLLYTGEWIESHALHVFMLHAPDFLGYESAIEIARDDPELVQRALDLKKTGNRIMTVVGGREIHPINVRVGGWYRTPTREELLELVAPLERARELALGAVEFAAGLPFPDYDRDYELVCLSEPGEYPIDRGRLISTGGLDLDISEYEEHFVEEHVPWSTALHSTLDGHSYLCGPLARFALCYDRLTPLAQRAARDAGIGPDVRNPFKSIVVRAIEMVHAADEALALIAAYEEPERPAVPVAPRAGVGWGCTEAPRGILYHRYEIDADGTILSAKIVPPTSQNQRTIEEDLRGVVESHVDTPDDELAVLCEQTIRNYDPCISCSTHFLKLDVVRR